MTSHRHNKNKSFCFGATSSVPFSRSRSDDATELRKNASGKKPHKSRTAYIAQELLAESYSPFSSSPTTQSPVPDSPYTPDADEKRISFGVVNTKTMSPVRDEELDNVKEFTFDSTKTSHKHKHKKRNNGETKRSMVESMQRRVSGEGRGAAGGGGGESGERYRPGLQINVKSPTALNSRRGLYIDTAAMEKADKRGLATDTTQVLPSSQRHVSEPMYDSGHMGYDQDEEEEEEEEDQMEHGYIDEHVQQYPQHISEDGIDDRMTQGWATEDLRYCLQGETGKHTDMSEQELIQQYKRKLTLNVKESDGIYPHIPSPSSVPLSTTTTHSHRHRTQQHDIGSPRTHHKGQHRLRTQKPSAPSPLESKHNIKDPHLIDDTWGSVEYSVPESLNYLSHQSAFDGSGRISPLPSAPSDPNLYQYTSPHLYDVPHASVTQPNHTSNTQSVPTSHPTDPVPSSSKWDNVFSQSHSRSQSTQPKYEKVGINVSCTRRTQSDATHPNHVYPSPLTYTTVHEPVTQYTPVHTSPPMALRRGNRGLRKVWSPKHKHNF